MSDYIGNWQKVEKLGEGGQGEVWKVRRSEAAGDRRQKLKEFVRELNQVVRYTEREENATRILQLVAELNAPEDLASLGAAKVFSNQLRSNKKARERLANEVAVLQKVDHPNVLKIRDADVASGFFVAEYHAGGTLAGASLYVGEPLAALRALRDVVDGLVTIHRNGAVHRDIKPQNILVGSDGRLVLADFGIVFFSDAQKTRITESIGERVGSSEWLAPWAHTGSAVSAEEIDPTFDLFGIGKVLWSMVAGRPVLPYWYWNHEGHDLTRIFPRQKDQMAIVNGVLEQVVVEHRPRCCPTADQFLGVMDEAIAKLELGGSCLRKAGWPCKMCGQGEYMSTYPNAPTDSAIRLWTVPDGGLKGLQNVTLFTCQVCGHTVMFRPMNGRLQGPAWKE